jgi:hypothetical protein
MGCFDKVRPMSGGGFSLCVGPRCSGSQNVGKYLEFFTAHPRMDIICDRMKAHRINGKQSLQKILWVGKTPGGLAVVTTWF